MFTDETDLKNEVREFTQYSTAILDQNGLNTSYRNAKRHIRREKNLPPESEYNWFNSDKVAAQDALYWWTCLFCKVQTGELDSQDFQAGAVDMKTLLATEGGEATTWYRQADDALNSMKSSTIIQSTGPVRNNREYQPGNYEEQGTGGGSSGGNVDASDL